MEIERRALYNLLRINWLNDRTLQVKPWQVEDYRQLDFEVLSQRLRKLGIPLDQDSFLAISEMSESPEELTDQILAELEEEGQVDAEEADQIYLLIFELWRRLISDKLSLSIFCDELDYQIFLYDSEQLNSLEPLQDILSTLLEVLKSNADKGLDPIETFQAVTSNCAHDIQAFLVDFISQQIDEGKLTYSALLLEGFSPYLGQNAWLKLLKARQLVANGDQKGALALLQSLLNFKRDEEDLELYLEVLSLLADDPSSDLFEQAALKSLSLLEVEEDLLDFIDILKECYQEAGDLAKEKQLTSLSLKRKIPLDRQLSSDDPAIDLLKRLF